MSKIQNAEEFANEIWADVEYTGSCLGIQAVRSRDRAIVERCKEEIKKTFVYGSQMRGLAALDSVLRELEGEEDR